MILLKETAVYIGEMTNNIKIRLLTLLLIGFNIVNEVLWFVTVSL